MCLETQHHGMMGMQSESLINVDLPRGITTRNTPHDNNNEAGVAEDLGRRPGTGQGRGRAWEGIRDIAPAVKERS